MTTLLFANNAQTTLASPITNSATSVILASGTGAIFPTITTGNAFMGTLVSATNPLLTEIVLCTARSADTVTIVRAQEGTAAQAFSAGDFFSNFLTAGTSATMVQSAQLQSGTYSYSVAAGTANALTATIASTLTAIPDGMSFIIKATANNSGPATLTLTLGATALVSQSIVDGSGNALAPGAIATGFDIFLIWNAGLSAYVIQNTSNSSGSGTQAINGEWQESSTSPIYQWGTTSSLASGSHTISYTIPFPNACFNVQIIGQSSNTSASSNYVNGAPGQTSFTLVNGSGTSIAFMWFAVGN